MTHMSLPGERAKYSRPICWYSSGRSGSIPYGSIVGSSWGVQPTVCQIAHSPTFSMMRVAQSCPTQRAAVR